MSISPLRDDTHGECEWLAPRPGSDVAIMLALAYVLATEGLADRCFLDRYCTGYDKFEDYLLGRTDGVPKSPQWAAELSGLSAHTLIELAHRMASSRTLVTVSWSLQRVRYGEQAPWTGITLAAMLGQIGVPGGGFGHGYGSMNEPGTAPVPYPLPTLFQGNNDVDDFIPVAAISDLLLRPGEKFDYDGKQYTFPDIRLVYWAGGNPFHHHQDIGRLRHALGRPDTIVVHDPYWTPMAKHADIVVPSTTTLERNDLTCTRSDPLLVAMQAAVPRFEDARDDYDTFSALAYRLGFGDRFTEKRSAQEWLEYLYGQWRGFVLADPARVEDPPEFDGFWRRGHVRMRTEDDLTLFEEFRDDPQRDPLRTPSGRIEIFSADIDGFGYEDCAGHPKWYEPEEWLGGARAEQFPLHLIANQPRTRLHGQLDTVRSARPRKFGGASRSGCIPATPQRATSRKVMWCGCSTTVVPASPGWYSTTGCCAASSSSRPVRGTTPSTRRTPGRCVCTETRTCSPPTWGPRACRTAAPGSTCSSRSSTSTVNSHRFGHTTHRPSGVVCETRHYSSDVAVV